MDRDWAEWIITNIVFIFLIPYIIFIYSGIYLGLGIISIYFVLLYFVSKYAKKKVTEKEEREND